MPLPRRHLLLPPAMLAVALFGCHPAPTPPPPKTDAPRATADTLPPDTRTFPIRGRVVAVRGPDVTLDHEAIPGFMEAMTMSYKLKDPNIASELHSGDRITANLLVQKGPDGFNNELLDDIVITAQARPDPKPTVQYHVPAPGDAVPNFAFLNQSDRTIHLDQFRGRAVLMTFIYTRCQAADFCPRMSRNFAEIDQALATDPALYHKTHLLSVSFDPAYDTPQVLRSYGGAYTGRFSKENFDHWDFAAPTPPELPQIAQFFDLGVTPGPGTRTLSHSLSTILIGKDGRVIAFYPSNDWKPADVLAQLKQAAS